MNTIMRVRRTLEIAEATAITTVMTVWLEGFPNVEYFIKPPSK